MYNTSYIRIARLFPRQSFNFTNALQTSISKVNQSRSRFLSPSFLHIFLPPLHLCFFLRKYHTSVRQYRSTVAFLVHSTITSRSPVKDLSGESSAIVYPFLIEPKNSFLSCAFRTALIQRSPLCITFGQVR